jgi:hypothetical protein
MDLADRDRALADCGGDALDRATAYVAHGGHASAAGLEHAVVAVGGGSVSTKPFASSGISPWSQLVWGPHRSAGQSCRRDALLLTGVEVVHQHLVEHRVADKLAHLAVAPHLDACGR